MTPPTSGGDSNPIPVHSKLESQETAAGAALARDHDDGVRELIHNLWFVFREHAFPNLEADKLLRAFAERHAERKNAQQMSCPHCRGEVGVILTTVADQGLLRQQLDAARAELEEIRISVMPMPGQTIVGAIQSDRSILTSATARIAELERALKKIRALEPENMACDYWSTNHGLKPDDVFDICDEAIEPKKEIKP